ncbi:MAG: pilV 2 [Francisellaceae bacterium]|nr:pilV 2 [Francisellaceae bacterium]
MRKDLRIKNRQSGGFSLAEVLIAMAISSIGAIGFIQMSFKAVYSIEEANFRNTALIFAQDMVGRIQANSFSTLLWNPANSPYTNSDYNFYPAQNLYPYRCYSTNPQASGFLSNIQSCHSYAMANNDLLEFKNNVATLPSGAAKICFDSNYNPSGDPSTTITCNTPTTPGIMPLTIKIWWLGRDGTYKSVLAYAALLPMFAL